MSRFIGKVGQLEGAVPITNDDVGRRAATILGGEGRLTMYAYFGDVCWWGGFLDNTRLVSNMTGAALTFSGASFESYVDRREMRRDEEHKQVEQTEYARMLWKYIQGTGLGSDVRVTTDFPPKSTKKRDMSWLRSEARKVGAILKEISNREDGFEWMIDVYEDEGQRRRELTVGYPQIGRPVSALTLSFPGNILSYEIEGDALDGGTSFQARGKAPDPVGKANPSGSKTSKGSEKTHPIMSAEFHSTDLLKVGYLRFDQTIERDTVTKVSTLDDWAKLARETRSGPLVLPVITCRIDGINQSILGSNVTIRIRDHIHPTGPYGEPGYNKVARVIGYEINPGEDGKHDTVKLVFENPYDEDHLERSPI